LNLEGGICCYTKVFFRPDIDIDIELKFLMMRLWSKKPWSPWSIGGY